MVLSVGLLVISFVVSLVPKLWARIQYECLLPLFLSELDAKLLAACVCFS